MHDSGTLCTAHSRFNGEERQRPWLHVKARDTQLALCPLSGLLQRDEPQQVQDRAVVLAGCQPSTIKLMGRHTLLYNAVN